MPIPAPPVRARRAAERRAAERRALAIHTLAPAAVLGTALAAAVAIATAPSPAGANVTSTAQAPTEAPDAILFTATGDGVATDDLFSILPDGTFKGALTTTATVSERMGDWSPDGAQVAYVAPRSDGPVAAASAIWILARDATGSALSIPLTFGPDDAAPDWSPDGRRIAFASVLERGRDQQVSSIAVVAPGGADQQIVLEPLASPHAVIAQPRWSPDGRRLAFVVDVDGGKTTAAPSAPNAGGEIYIVNADGSGARRLFAHPGWDDGDPAWSPDGRLIAFTSAPLAAGPSGDVPGSGTIWLLDPSTGAAGVVLAERFHHLDNPKWSPDGRQLVIVRWHTVLPMLVTAEPPELVIVDVAAPMIGEPLTAGRAPDWARRPLLPSPSPGPTDHGPTPTEGPSPATTPTPPAEPATPTPPPIPGLTPFPTLAPFPTLPPREPTLPPVAPTWPLPSATHTPSPTLTPTPSATSTRAATETATRAPGGRVLLPIGLAAYPVGEPEATPTPSAEATAERVGAGSHGRRVPQGRPPAPGALRAPTPPPILGEGNHAQRLHPRPSPSIGGGTGWPKASQGWGPAAGHPPAPTHP